MDPGRRNIYRGFRNAVFIFAQSLEKFFGDEQDMGWTGAGMN